MAKMSKFVTPVAKGAFTRTIIDLLIRNASNTRFLEQFMGMFAQFCRSFPLLEAIGAEVINVLPPTIRSIVEPVWRRVMYGYPREEDMAKQKGGKDQNGKSDPTARAFSNIVSLGQPYASTFFEQLDKISSPLLREKVLSVLASMQPHGLKTLADMLAANKELTLADKLFPEGVSEAGGVSSLHTTSNKEKASKVLNWLDEDTRDKIVAVLASVANDTPDDRLRFDENLAALYGKGTKKDKERAKRFLAVIAKEEDVQRRANCLGVRQNYLTKLTRLPQNIGRFFRKPVKPGASRQFLAVVNARRLLRGRLPISPTEVERS